MLFPYRRSLLVALRTYSTTAATAASAEGAGLAATVAPHRLYLLLHSQRPISELPSRPSSEVQRSLQLALARRAIVNFAWNSQGQVGPFPADSADTARDGQTEEVYAATAYTSQGRVDIPSVSLANVKDVINCLDGPTREISADDSIDIYVCTHGARDCRCGDTGTAVLQALREGIAERAASDAEGLWKRIRLGEVAHVGGHQ
jgi:hypothetical protein